MRFVYDFVIGVFVLTLLLLVSVQHAELETMRWEISSAEKYLFNKMMGYDQKLVKGQNYLERLLADQKALEFTLDLHREYLKTDAEEIDELRQSFVDLRDKMTLLAWLHDNNWEAMMKANALEDLVFITRDWKILQIPKWLNLQDGDEDFLKKFLEVKDK